MNQERLSHHVADILTVLMWVGAVLMLAALW